MTGRTVKYYCKKEEGFCLSTDEGTILDKVRVGGSDAYVVEVKGGYVTLVHPKDIYQIEKGSPRYPFPEIETTTKQ